MGLVGDLTAATANDIPSLLLFNVVEFLLSCLVDGDYFLLQCSELLLETGDETVEVILAALILVQFLIQENHLRLIADLFPLVERFLEHDSVALVLKLPILIVVIN